MGEDCPGTNERGEPCGLDAGWGVDGESTGPCTYHRHDDTRSRGAPEGNQYAVGNDGGAPEGNDNAVGNSGGGPPENNDNAETHGMSANARKWFERHRSEVESEVRLTVAAAVEEAPFSWHNHLKMKVLVSAAINFEQENKGSQYIADQGILTERVVGRRQDGTPVKDIDEHPSLLSKSRLQRDGIRLLKELGYLDDPDSQQAEATESVAAMLGEQ